MTIRRQILLFVLPLFVVIGGISSAFSGWLELTVARGSYIDGSEAIAISTAEWITPADLSALRAGTPLAQTRLGLITDRLLLMWLYYPVKVALLINIILLAFLLVFLKNGWEIYSRLYVKDDEAISG